MRKHIKRIALLSGFASILAYVGLAISFYSGQPKPTTNYLAMLNADYDGVAESDKAWNDYRDVWAKYEFCEGPGGRFEELYDEEHELVTPADGDAWQAAIKKLADSEELLECLRVGGAKPYLGLELKASAADYAEADRAALFPNQTIGSVDDSDTPPMVIAVLLPHVQSFRNCARILHVDCRWALEQGDTERATRNVEAIFGMSAQAAEPNCLVCGLVGIAVQRIGLEVVSELLETGIDPFSDKQLKRIQAAILRDDVAGFFRIDGEKAMLLDVIQHCYTDDGSGSGRLTAQGLRVMHGMQSGNFWMEDYTPGEGTELVMSVAGPFAPVWFASRGELVDKANELYALIDADMRRPYHELQSSEFDDHVDQLNSRFALLKVLMPSLDGIRKRTLGARCEQLATGTAIAVVRCQRDQGDLPQSLNDLIGDYIAEVPTDPIDGNPLRYGVANGTFRIYSVGLDGDDDGGNAPWVSANGGISPPNQRALPEAEKVSEDLIPQPAGDFNWNHPYKLDGDWVLWPRRTDGPITR